MTKMIYLPCKGCRGVVEFPEPEPKTVAIKEPCKCGMTSEARQSRHIATAVTIVAIMAILGGLGGCWTVNSNEANVIRAQTQKLQAEMISDKAENERLKKEVAKYRDIMDELRKVPVLKLEEKYERPPVDGRATPVLQPKKD